MSGKPYIEKLSPEVTLVNFYGVKAGWEQWILARSDAHHDNKHSNHKLEKRHLDQCVERNGLWFDAGDLMCVMQGKKDRRADRKAERKEHAANDYYDTVVDTCADFYRPYADNCIQLSPGNHEQAIEQHNNTNLTKRLAKELGVNVGTYAGFIGFRFHFNKTCYTTLWLYYHHGWGGGGPVTKGVIQASRMAAYLSSEVRIIYTGHTHDNWEFPNYIYGISKTGKPYIKEQTFIRGSGYKDEFSEQEGWHIRRGGGPKGTGAWWIKLYLGPGGAENREISYDTIRAK